MKARYEVIEYRGAGIEYTAFEGTHAECNKWLANNCHEEAGCMDEPYTNLVANDSTCVNGDGFAWKYFIQISFEKW